MDGKSDLIQEVVDEAASLRWAKFDRMERPSDGLLKTVGSHDRIRMPARMDDERDSGTGRSRSIAHRRGAIWTERRAPRLDLGTLACDLQPARWPSTATPIPRHDSLRDPIRSTRQNLAACDSAPRLPQSAHLRRSTTSPLETRDRPAASRAGRSLAASGRSHQESVGRADEGDRPGSRGGSAGGSASLGTRDGARGGCGRVAAMEDGGRCWSDSRSPG